MASDRDDGSRAASPTPSQLPPVPSSPVYSIASTANPISQFNLPLPPAPRPRHAVLTKTDIESSQAAYSDLLASAKAYRVALATLSSAASSFGSALEACARLKEARAEPIGPLAAVGGTSMTASFTTSRGACTADTLMSASGLHHVVANHQQILSDTVYRAFEVPLLHDLDKWQRVMDDEEETYKAKIKAQTKEVRKLEREGLKLHKQRRRDVARFRAHLVELTAKLDGLTTLHGDHARTLLRESQDTSNHIVDASCSLVRAEVDIYEGLARKGWTGGGLEDLLEKGSDLFASDDAGPGVGDPAASSAKLFSILPPRSILADAAAVDLPRPGPGGHTRSDSLLSDPERYQSLAALAGDPNADGAAYSADFNKPRGARPFSPQPIRRVPADVTSDSLGAVGVANHGDGVEQQEMKAEQGEQKQDQQDEDREESPRGRPRSRRSSQGEGDDESSAHAWGERNEV